MSIRLVRIKKPVVDERRDMFKRQFKTLKQRIKDINSIIKKKREDIKNLVSYRKFIIKELHHEYVSRIIKELHHEYVSRKHSDSAL